MKQILAAFLFCFSLAAPAQWTIGQHSAVVSRTAPTIVAGSCISSNSPATLGAALSVGDWLIAFDQSNVSPSAPTSPGLTFTQVGTTFVGAYGLKYLKIFIAPITSPATPVITFSASQAIIACGVRGGLSSSPIDSLGTGASGNSGSNQVISSGPSTTTYTPDLLFAYVSESSLQGLTSTQCTNAGWTLLASASGYNTVCAKTTTADGAQAAFSTGTLATVGSWFGMQVSFSGK